MINIIRKEPVIKKSIFIMMMSIIVIFSIFTVFQYNNLKNIYLEQENINKRVVGILVNKYPQQEVDIVKSIYKQDNRYLDLGAKTLDKYGYDNNYNMYENVNFKERLKYFLVNNLTVFVIIIILVSFIVFNFTKYMYNRLLKVNSDIENIINNKYIAQEEFKEEGVFNRIYTDLNKLSRSLNLKISSLDKEKESIKELVTDISHQLKTPLTSMSIMVDNIMDNPEMDSKTRSEFIKDIRREIININFLVNSLLKLSKLDANSVYFINKEVYVEEIILESIKNVSVLCDLKNIDILVDGNKQIKINCDLKWQVEAITNILKNCVEHSKDNSKIEIFYEENNVYTKIEIKDYGVGIDKEDLTHIFERFYKGKNSSNESVGIGLALSKSIIENNNGYIGVESEIRKGSLFIIKYFK